ncbi:hypothetical protein B4143_3532 [Bacillus subtilis]|uniref:Uncharacterized protein n=1 Tax=Bacillus subtilis subsp. subtilis TaxID=135461 RepID=A0ABD3ZZ69_BACIU|nr:Hypothetical Protein U712_19225 [Bacillus subtilis PY79]KIL33521.1 hypothetical protein B4067_4344 [Bacillus subtilis subsp. subtilis]KIO57522.1 hypothetical protein B4143_3532 [Bacillus subtilis]
MCYSSQKPPYHFLSYPKKSDLKSEMLCTKKDSLCKGCLHIKN